MLRLLLLETGSAFAERLASALSCYGNAVCQRETLANLELEQSLRRRYLSGCDAVVVDLRQEHRDPHGVCRRVAACVQERPIVAVTSIDDVDLAVRLVEAGADDVCLRHECGVEQLMRRMRAAAARYQAHSLWQRVATSAGHVAGTSPVLQLTLQRDRTVADLHQFADDSPLVRALCIDPSQELLPQRTWIRSAGFQLPMEIECVPGMREAIRALNEADVDVVVLRLAELCSTALEAVTILRSCAPDAQLFVSSPSTDDDLVVDAIHHGADDVLCGSDQLFAALLRSIRLAFARKWRRHDDHETTPAEPGGGAPALIGDSREQDQRYPITRGAVAIPINPDFTPNLTVCAEGFTVDLSMTGVRFELGRLTELPSEYLLIGVEGNDAALRFATVRVRHWTTRAGRVQVGAEFVPSDQELLRDENLIPTLRPDTFRYATGLPAETLRRWADAGILRSVQLDRVYVCPKCGALPTFRRGCRSCGSIHIANHPVILHTACAYVAIETEFLRDGALVCPKCGQSEPAVGGEFARHSGPCHCLDCGWADADTEVVGQCLHCHWHFPLERAQDRELLGYHVNRLDPRALCGR